jgi:hypothetical protein
MYGNMQTQLRIFAKKRNFWIHAVYFGARRFGGTLMSKRNLQMETARFCVMIPCSFVGGTEISEEYTAHIF